MNWLSDKLSRWTSSGHLNYLEMLKASPTGLEIKPKKTVIHIDGKQVHIRPPVYKDAHELYETTQDMELKRQVSIYIQIYNHMQRQRLLHAVADRAKVSRDVAILIERHKIDLTAKHIGGIIQHKKAQLELYASGSLHEQEAKAYIPYIELDAEVLQIINDDAPKTNLKKPAKKPARRVNIDHNAIKESAKRQILANLAEKYNFPFRTIEECKSRAATAPYYISKKDLLEMIKSSPDIKAQMPKNYSKLDKEGLCGAFFTKEAIDNTKN